MASTSYATYIISLLEAKNTSLKVIAYHRTKSLKTLANVLQPEVREDGARALYLTYDLESQLNRRMISIYGKILVRFTVSISKILVFDKQFLKEKYGEIIPLTTQWKNAVSSVREDDLSFIKSLDDVWFNSKNLYLSGPVKALFRHFNPSYLASLGIDGVLFAGSLDGKVLVLFDMKKAKPVDYSISSNPQDVLQWKSV